MEITIKQCPCCDAYQAGYPLPILGGGLSSSDWPEHLRWRFRWDLGDAICPECDIALGKDLVRAKLQQAA